MSGTADRLIVALDATTLARAVAMARQVRGLARTLKIGSALFTACGPSAIRRVQALGFSVMLDLKFFDIPSTVELSCRAAARHRVAMLTVHAAGGRAMLEAAVRGAREEARRLNRRRPLVLAVTVLTSVDRAPAGSLAQQVSAMAAVALEAGCDGLVASAQEAGMLRRRFGPRPRIVCPGIRPGSLQGTRAPVGASPTAPDDQRRVCTPSAALAAGADALVIGRPITAARRPRAAAQRIVEELYETTSAR